LWVTPIFHNSRFIRQANVALFVTVLCSGSVGKPKNLCGCGNNSLAEGRPRCAEIPWYWLAIWARLVRNQWQQCVLRRSAKGKRSRWYS